MASQQQPYRPPRASSRLRGPNVKWRTLIVMVLFWAAAMTDYSWPWGIMFLIMSIPPLFSGESYFIERLTKREQPILFYFVVWSFIITSVAMIVIDVVKIFG